METKECNRCHQIKELNEFYSSKRPNQNQLYYAAMCKLCQIDYYRARQKNNPELSNKYGRNSRLKVRTEVLKHYGNKCQCCGETTPEFLAIDHINGNGTEHRRQINRRNINVWLKNNNYPEGFQILCHNCNLAKGFYGECPHKRKPEQ